MAARRPQGARPSGSSQHFLRDARLAEQLVDGVHIGSGDLVVDIGAGSGRLTGPLARRAGRVIAIEADERLASRLRAGAPQNVEVVHDDVLASELPGAPFRVVANLPFDQTTAILHLLLDDPSTKLVRADVVVEWGVAVQLALPWPSRVRSVLWRAGYEIVVLRRLPRTCFEPPPRVDAALLSFRRREEPLVPPGRHEAYRRFVAAGFRRGPQAVAPSRPLQRIAGRARNARDLDAHQWAELFLANGSHGRRDRRWSPRP